MTAQQPNTNALETNEERSLSITPDMLPKIAITMPLDVMFWWEDAAMKEAVRTQICQGATDAEMMIFIAQCKLTGLNPIARQIYLVKRNQWDSATRSYVNKATIQTSIDGYRLIANRTHEYRGQVGPWWCGPNGEWVDVWLASEPPAAARVGVFRDGFVQPVYGIALFGSYAQKSSTGDLVSVWKSNPSHMLAKCAEALALRRAFPQEMSGVYTAEEMGQADNPRLTTASKTTLDLKARSGARPSEQLPAKSPNVRPFTPSELQLNFAKVVAAVEAKGLLLGPDDFSIVESALGDLFESEHDLEVYLEFVVTIPYLEDMSESHLVALMRLLKPASMDGRYSPCADAVTEAKAVIAWTIDHPGPINEALDDGLDASIVGK